MADIRTRTSPDGTKVHQVRFKDNSNKSGYGYKSFKKIGRAKAFEAEKTLEEENGFNLLSKKLQVNKAVQMWLEICQIEGLDGSHPVSNCTFENYKYRASFINEYHWPLFLNELKPSDIVAYRSWLLQQKLSRDLCRKILTTLHSVFKEMTIRGYMNSNVASGINIKESSRHKKEVQIPNKQEVILLLKTADSLANSDNKQLADAWAKYRALMYLAIDSGMRPQEYLAISSEDLKENGVMVQKAIEGDGKAIGLTKTAAGKRFIELNKKTLTLLREYALNHSVKNKHDLIFTTSTGNWLCRRNWKRSGFNVACIKAGLIKEGTEESLKPKPKYRPYQLRHFYASMLFEKKENLKKIQTLMGHAKIETTLNVYGHLLDDPALQTSHQGILSDL